MDEVRRSIDLESGEFEEIWGGIVRVHMLGGRGGWAVSGVRYGRATGVFLPGIPSLGVTTAQVDRECSVIHRCPIGRLREDDVVGEKFPLPLGFVIRGTLCLQLINRGIDRIAETRSIE